MEFLIGIVVLIIALIAYEYRIRKPDYYIIYETKDGLAVRKSRIYPRHFSLPLLRTTHSFQLAVNATAKGNIDIKVNLSVTVGASIEYLTELIRAGGWKTDATIRAAKELETILQGYVKEFTEQHEIEELSSQKILDYLNKVAPVSKKSLGLEIVFLTILSLDPVNAKIAEALKQQEQARILEHTDMLNNKARIASAKAKFKADEEIASLENQLELKKYELKKNILERESQLNDFQVNEELKRSRKKLELDREELEMLKSSPELLMLTPQAARLAEASQSLKNAKTIVTLSPQDINHGSELFSMFHNIIQNALESYRSTKEKKQTK